MANFVKLFSLTCTLALVTSCGSNPIQSLSDEAKNESPEVEADEADFALNGLLGKNSGAIVVEKTISLPRAVNSLIFPAPPVSKCFVNAGAHLVNVSALGEFEFIAKVTYPKGYTRIFAKDSCGEGELVTVRAGSGFLGLAVTANKAGTKFRQVLTSKAPETQCSVHADRQNIKIDASSDSYGRILGTTVAASDKINKIYIKGECPLGAKLIVDSKSLAGVLGEKRSK